MELSNIEYLGIDRVIRRGTGETLDRCDKALLVRDNVSGAFMLACDDPAAGLSLLDRHMSSGCDLLMVPGPELGKEVFKRYGFSQMLECYQVAYYGEPPAFDADVSVRTAGPDDLPFLISSYHLISPAEMEQVVERQTMLLGYVQDELVGFIGEHLEGSMGLLYILPEFRRRGYASTLEKLCIAKTMERGFIPFGQVEKDNHASLLLQQKIGMTRSESLICWMWK